MWEVWHQISSARHGIIQSKNDSGYHFGAQKVWHPNSPFLGCLYCQKQLKTKFLVKNGMIFILKSVLKECAYKKDQLLQQSIFVYTKHKTEHKRYLSVTFFTFVMLWRLDTFKSCIWSCQGSIIYKCELKVHTCDCFYMYVV